MKRILACTDLSDGAHEAMVRAVALAARSGASLTIVHVAPEESEAPDDVRDAIRDAVRSETETTGAQALEVQVRIPHGRPEDAIISEAARCRADLIVLGGHGRPRFRDAIFGTVGTHIVRHSPVAVLIVQSEAALPYSKLLVAAEAAETAPRLAEDALALAPEAEVFTVHAFAPPLAEGLFCPSARERDAGRQEAALKTSLANLSVARPKALLDADGHIIVEEGAPLTVIMDQAEQILPDLVVMGARHRDTFFGSRGVDALFWCPADLLIVPEASPALADA